MSTAPTPRDVVLAWVDAFTGRMSTLSPPLYAVDAVNHLVADAPLTRRVTIQARFEQEFATADMLCLVENLFQVGDWAIGQPSPRVATCRRQGGFLGTRRFLPGRPTACHFGGHGRQF